MKRLITFLIVTGIGFSAFSQTCTISGSGTIAWNPLTTPTCVEGGVTTATATILVIPAGVTLDFDDNGDTWTGTRIDIFGTLLISAPGQVTINSSMLVKSGGILKIDSKINIGSSGGCGYTLTINSGGTVDILGSTPDRLSICGVEIARGGTSGCNTYPAGPIPYCEPSGGFTGPIVLTESGLPIELLFFKGSKSLNKISLSWATSSELNFDYFDIEKSADGKIFQNISRITGHGTTNERNDYAMVDEKPYIGKNYYRLKSVDFDGYTEYFNVVMVDFDGSKAFSVSPNPFDGITFTTETNFVPQTRAFVAIYSTLGSEIARYEVSGEKSELVMPVKLASGIYYAKYISADFTSTNRVVVK